MKKHKLSNYTCEMLIDLCKEYQYIKEIPQWLYLAIRRRGIGDKATLHMRNLNPRRTYEEVEIEAKKYEYRGDFQKHSNWAYQWARKHHVMNKVCIHMKKKINAKNRCLYLVTFDDNTAYVGITWNTADRWSRHMNPDARYVSPVYIHYVETGLKPHFKQLTDYLPATESADEETKYIEKNPNHYNLLNSSKGGELGSIHSRWSKKKLLFIAERCNSYKDFQNCKGAYSYAVKNDLLEDIQKILPRKREIWTEGHIMEVLDGCKNRKEAPEKYAGAINAAKAMGKYEKFIGNLERKHALPYTEKQIRESVAKLKYREDFAKLSRSMVNTSKVLGIYEEVIQTLPIKPRGKSLEEYIELARSFKHRGEFKKAHPGAYAVIISKEGWAEKCFAHMKYQCRVNLTDTEILRGALKFDSVNDWIKNGKGEYAAAKERGLYERATAHMRRPEPHNKIDDSYYIELCSHYTDYTLFRKEHKNEYIAIKRRGKDFFEQCTKNMIKRKHQRPIE